jgi:hypothetical protein
MYNSGKSKPCGKGGKSETSGKCREQEIIIAIPLDGRKKCPHV